MNQLFVNASPAASDCCPGLLTSVQLAARAGYWKAAVAIAANNARTCWAVLAGGESFKLPV